MIINLIPQVRWGQKIWYNIEYQKITVTIDGATDVFDFRDMEDGELEIYDSEGKETVHTLLPENPIRKASKKDGILTVSIVFSIEHKEKDERLTSPKPMTLSEFNSLMNSIAETRRLKKEKDIN